jgi:hypothetical protein
MSIANDIQVVIVSLDMTQICTSDFVPVARVRVDITFNNMYNKAASSTYGVALARPRCDDLNAVCNSICKTVTTVFAINCLTHQLLDAQGRQID